MAAVWQAGVASRERDRAERRFNDVRQLSNALLFEISPKIERLQGATEAREILVSRALEYLDSLAQEADGDLSLQMELASAYEKIGDLQGNPSNPNLVDLDSAIASYGKAFEIRSRALERDPRSEELQKKLADNLRISGKIHGQANDYQTESKNLNASLDLLDQLVTAESRQRDRTFAIAEVTYEIGRNRTALTKYSDSFPYFEKAIAALEDLRIGARDDAEVLKLLGDCRVQFALALSWEKRQEEAEKEAAKGIADLERAVAVRPADINLISSLWSGYWVTSSVYEDQDDRAAHELALKALSLAENTVRGDAANIRAKQQLAKSYSRVGQTSTNIGKPAEAVKSLETARGMMLEITDTRSRNKGLKTDLTSILMRLGAAKFEQKDHEAGTGQF